MQPIAQNGYTYEEVKKVLHASKRQLFFRYDLLDSANKLKGRLTNVLAASVSNNALAAIKRTARFKLKDDGSVNYLSDRIKPYARLAMPDLVQGTDGASLTPAGVPTFTRASVAYKQDGTQVAANEPRYEAGQFGQAVMVEEGTTNLVAGANVEAGAFSAYVVTTTHPVTGKQIKAIKLPVGVNTPVTQSPTLNLLTNTSYTVSFEIWASDNLNARINVDLFPDSLPEIGVTPTTTVQKITWTLTSASTDMNGCSLRFFDNSVQPMPNDVYITYIQLEQKPYATSFVDGTRAAESLTAPTAGVINSQQGTVEFWLYPQSFGDVNNYLGIGGTAGLTSTEDNNTYEVYYLFGVLYARWGTGSATVSASSTIGQLVLNQWTLISISWQANGTLNLYINGQLANSVSLGALSPIFPFGNIYIGLNRNGVSGAQSLIDDLRISSIARTDAEILAAYQSNAPLLVDEYTTYKLNFDGSLAHGQGTYKQTSIDVSSLGSAQTSSINWDAVTPQGTTAKVEASLDGAIWSELVNDGTLIGPGQSLIGKTLQLKQKLTTTDTAQIPEITKLDYRILGKAISGKSYAEWPLGVFVLSTPPRKTDSAGVVTREVEAYDLLQVLVDDKVEDRYIVTAGTNYIVAVKVILDSAGLTAQNLTTTDKALPADRDWSPGTPKLNIINDLLGAINYRSLSFDENGLAVAQPYVSPDVRASEYTYSDDDDSVIFPEVEQGLDLFAIPNKWVLIVSEPDRAPLISTYTNSNPGSPTSTVNRGRTIVDYREGVEAVDQTTLDAKAQRMAYEASQVYEQVNFETGIMPQHSDSDILTLEFTALGISAKYSETEWSFELKAGAKMQHRIRRVVSV